MEPLGPGRIRNELNYIKKKKMGHELSVLLKKLFEQRFEKMERYSELSKLKLVVEVEKIKKVN